jgi:peptide/nickel transport system permease protein
LIFFVIVLNWIIFEAMPGLQGSISSLLGNPGRGFNTAQIDRLNNIYGFNKPVWVQFTDYVQAMLTFNFGFSYQTGLDVSSELIQSGRLVNTLVLIGSSTVLSIIIGIFLGIWAAHKRGSFLDSFSVTTSLVAFSLPIFWVAILLILPLSLQLHWFPSSGLLPANWSIPGQRPDLFTQILVRLQYLFLPSLTLTFISYGGFLLLTRATMLETLSEDYILTARAKGLSQRVILLHHAFKNASLPIITASALSFGFILSGAIITETIFNWPGLGKWLFDSIQYKDFPVMQAMFFIIGLCVIAANFISDILYGVVDPRIKYE